MSFHAVLTINGENDIILKDSGGSEGVSYSSSLVNIDIETCKLLYWGFCQRFAEVGTSARAWLTESISSLANYNTLTYHERETIRGYVEDLFGITNTGNTGNLHLDLRTRLLDVLAKVRNGCANNLTIKVYRPIGVTHQGYVHTKNFYKKTWALGLPVLFKSQRKVHINADVNDLEKLTKTLIHESTHKFAYTHDYFYINNGLHGDWLINTAIQNRVNRLNNADSYAWLCYRIASLRLQNTLTSPSGQYKYRQARIDKNKWQWGLIPEILVS